MTPNPDLAHLQSLARDAVRELREAAYRVQDTAPDSPDAERMLDVADALAEQLARMA
ncbi:hypothetical protein KVH09_36695 [Streptomyces olivaceus]|uniref:hypothetical protein n=1 Tax=Streptomyces olivaceus TaxID=47716 RepID=UPI001CCD957A|nr:hypothetical protein [Streptomyces olivaceus]MBZ6296102.1 hypothetical protein [Streptomyces olivaceus]